MIMTFHSRNQLVPRKDMLLLCFTNEESPGNLLKKGTLNDESLDKTEFILGMSPNQGPLGISRTRGSNVNRCLAWRCPEAASLHRHKEGTVGTHSLGS